MPNYIDITGPAPNDTIGRSFFVTGSSAFGVATGAGVTIRVSLADSAGNPIVLQNGGGNPHIDINVPTGMTLYAWFAQLVVNANHDDCTITAQLTDPAGGGNPTDEVEPVDIMNQSGGGLLFP